MDQAQQRLLGSCTVPGARTSDPGADAAPPAAPEGPARFRTLGGGARRSSGRCSAALGARGDRLGARAPARAARRRLQGAVPRPVPGARAGGRLRRDPRSARGRRSRASPGTTGSWPRAGWPSASTWPSATRRSPTRSACITPDKVALGALAIVLVLEATRRLAGWALVWVALACLAYAKFAALLPGAPHREERRLGAPRRLPLSRRQRALRRRRSRWPPSIVVAFVLFGQALGAVGGDRFLTDLALVAMGRYRGGPAKVAVVSSTLFGTVSGSAVSNVVVDGALTIPMMKRAGYPPHLAAAIEAVASNGGQIMPPVMGAAAFLIAEYLGLSYGEVALAAAIPAGPLLPGAVRPGGPGGGQARAGRAAAPPSCRGSGRSSGRAACSWSRSASSSTRSWSPAGSPAGRGWPPPARRSRVGALGRRRGRRWRRRRDRRGGDGPHDARPHGDHRAGGARHRRAAALRLHVEAAAAPGRASPASTSSGCSSSPPSSASSSACRCPRRSSTSRWRSWSAPG